MEQASEARMLKLTFYKIMWGCQKFLIKEMMG